jgi:hypothetical protein
MRKLTLIAVMGASAFALAGASPAGAAGSPTSASWQDLRSPDSVAPTESGPVPGPARMHASTVQKPTPQGQDLRGERAKDSSQAVDVTLAARGRTLRAPDGVAPTQRTVAPAAASSHATLPADGGLSTFLIVLISLAGAVALAGAGYTAMRLSHAHGAPPVA